MSSSNLFNQMIEAQQRYQNALLRKSNVVGVAVGYKNRQGESSGELSVVALVEEKKPLAALTEDDMIPKELEGAPTDVFEVGKLVAHQQSTRSRFRPTIPGGVSISHTKVGAGTLGTIVKDRKTGDKLILSNNHVLAASNDALIGDVILQPGPVDGGQNPADVVAKLERFIKLNYQGDEPDPTPTPDPGDGGDTPSTPPTSSCDIVNIVVQLANTIAKLNGSEQRVQAKPTATALATAQSLDNLVDAALARPVDPTMFTDDILKIGQIIGIKEPTLGMKIRKTGRTTDYTESVVTLLNATVNVGYNTSAGNKTARFTEQVIAQAMSQPGDSGSLIVEIGANNAVGLLFAGSNVSTIFTPISRVLKILDVTF